MQLEEDYEPGFLWCDNDVSATLEINGESYDADVSWSLTRKNACNLAFSGVTVPGWATISVDGWAGSMVPSFAVRGWTRVYLANRWTDLDIDIGGIPLH